MIALAGDVFWGLTLVALAALAATLAVRIVGELRRQCQLHQHRANKRFLAGYRAGFQARRLTVSRTTVEAVSPAPWLPVVRPPTPTGRGRHAA